MEDSVAHVDGSTHDREYIERWFRERQQKRQPVKHRRQEEEELEPEAAVPKPVKKRRSARQPQYQTPLFSPNPQASWKTQLPM